MRLVSSFSHLSSSFKINCGRSNGDGWSVTLFNGDRTNTDIGAFGEDHSHITVGISKSVGGFKSQHIVLSTADFQLFDIGEGFAVSRALDGGVGGVATANHLHTDGDLARLAVGLHLDVVASTIKLDEIRRVACGIIATQAIRSYAIQSQEIGFWSTFPNERQHGIVNHRSGLGDGDEVGIHQVVLCIMTKHLEVSCTCFVTGVGCCQNK